MHKLLKKFDIHRPNDLNKLDINDIIEIQGLMKPIAKRQFTRLLHTLLEKKLKSSSCHSMNNINAEENIHNNNNNNQILITEEEWLQLIRLSNDRCKYCGDLLKPVKIKKQYVYEILKVTNSIDIEDTIRLSKYTTTYCNSYIDSLNTAWFLLHNKHSIIEDKNEDNSYLYTVDNVKEILINCNIHCADDLILLNEDTMMEIKRIMRIKAKKEFSSHIRIFMKHIQKQDIKQQKEIEEKLSLLVSIK